MKRTLSALFKDPYKSPHGRVEEFEFAGRRYQAFVPNGVNADSPLLITHDAQSYLLDVRKTWNGMNWGVSEALNQNRITNHATRGLPLIVSVHLTASNLRLNDLAPEDFMARNPEFWQAALERFKPASDDLLGNDYIDDVVTNLLPELTRRYGIKPTRAATAIAGSSMGGLASLYAMGRHPGVFGAALAYSTHWVIGENPLVEYLLNRIPNDGKHIIWSDRGDLELDATYEPFHKHAEHLLEKAGWERDTNYITAVFYGTAHREDYWARRIELPINWWLTKV
jgi:Putative esterase